MEHQLDFVAVGDIVTDAFIRIKEASVLHLEGPDGQAEEELCLVNGAKIPYEFATVIPSVGNSPNAAVAAVRLGLSTALVTDLGTDEHGKECLAALDAQHIDRRFVTAHEGALTNYHYVLWHKAERTILIKHEAYDYHFPDIGNPKWLYLSSLGEHTKEYHTEIAQYLIAHPDIKLAFQPGTFQIKFGVEAMKPFYEHCEIFFCNVEEARLILGDMTSDRTALPRKMSDLGPKIAVITDGPAGALAFDRSTGATWFMPLYPDPAPPYERTGAGDAFASTVTSALALGLSLEDALRWGPINSMSVVQKIGAQEGLLGRPALEAFLAQAPADYHPTRIS